jgi:hypothetical protein
MRPTADEFWASVDKQPGPDGCWAWTGRRDRAGYGRLHFDDRDQGAHRYAWILAHGGIAPTAHVLHRCPDRACVRPAHLVALTPAEAGPYKAARGYMARGDRHTSHLYPERQARGERQGSAKLTGGQVEQIRLRYAGGEAPITRLAEEYGVGTSQIWRIVTGQSRQHDPGPTRTP